MLYYLYLSLQKYIVFCLLKIFFSMLSVPFYHHNFLLKDQCRFNLFLSSNSFKSSTAQMLFPEVVHNCIHL